MSEFKDRQDEPERRGFFTQFLAGAIGVLVGAVPAVFGSLFFLDPLLRKKRSESGPNDQSGVLKDEEGFINLKVSVSSLPDDGTPQAFKVRDDKVDAWNKFKDVEIGTVWIRKDDEGNVVAFNNICPHLGCAVDYRQSNNDFFCPCHTSTFDLCGERMNQIPPRPMDRLELKTKSETGDQIWLKYENFRAATPDKVPV